MNRNVLKVLALVLVVAAAFAAGRYGRRPAAVPEGVSPAVSSPPPAAIPARSAPTSAAPARGCVGPGSTREQVLEALGEPDSIVGGWWYYGRSQLHLGSGTVQDYVNGGGLSIC